MKITFKHEDVVSEMPIGPITVGESPPSPMWFTLEQASFIAAILVAELEEV
jgi:hypothetical protein